MYYFFEYWWLLVPGMLLSIFAQWKVMSTYKKYQKVLTKKNITGAQTARHILKAYNINDINVEETGGTLSDHYSPHEKVIRLSSAVYGGTDIAALGIAAHEVGHAIQYSKSYAPIAIRNTIFPVASLGSNLGYILIILGMFIGGLGSISQLFILGGIVLFSFFVFFTIVTLPVEFDASSRAIKILSKGGFLDTEEIEGAKKVLNAAALTYIASAITAIFNLVRLVLMSRSRN